MFCVLDDMIVEISIETDGDDTTVKVAGYDGDLWEDLIPKMLSSTDPNAAEIISELLIWLDANNVKNEQSARLARDGGNINSCGNNNSDDNKANTMTNESGSYLDKFDETLTDFKTAQGVRMVQAMAGSVPILIYKAVPDTYCFSFPPSTMVYTIDDVKEMARTGRYTFGKRYMDTLLEILDGSR